jgi:hypothetical protein
MSGGSPTFIITTMKSTYKANSSNAKYHSTMVNMYIIAETTQSIIYRFTNANSDIQYSIIINKLIEQSLDWSEKLECILNCFLLQRAKHNRFDNYIPGFLTIATTMIAATTAKKSTVDMTHLIVLTVVSIA